jgi:exosortase E/protease (VPEID-CTERM system)
MAGILAMECVPVTMLRHPWLHARTFTASAIFFFVAAIFFGRDKLRAMEWKVLSTNRGWVAAHVCAMALLIVTNVYLLYFGENGAALERGLIGLWYVWLVMLPVTLGEALFGHSKLLLLLRCLGSAWGLAALCAVAMYFARDLMMTAWNTPDSWFGHAMQSMTFRGVRRLLGLFYNDVFTDPGQYVIGTRAFAIQIAGVCSGVEGLALMLSLTVGWLIFSRRELRMGRALLLVPVSLILIILLNIARIAALIAIGDAGYGSVAIGGFHSEAGWILFSCVALGFLLAVNTMSWFRIARPASEIEGSGPQVSLNPLAETNVAAVYLMPFLAILAAGLVSVAISDGFEWLYGLRLIAALGVLYAYRHEYRRMDWRFGWLGPAAGVAVFALWIGLDRWMGSSAAAGGVTLTSVPEGLARLSSGQRTAWIVVRTITAVVTVPVAEELAFRGYLARRLMSADVEAVPFRGLSVVAVLGSSLAFGALPGRMWLAGMLTGVVFALVTKLRGRLGEAVAAHATANLMIAVWVLARGDYSLW